MGSGKRFQGPSALRSGRLVQVTEAANCPCLAPVRTEAHRCVHSVHNASSSRGRSSRVLPGPSCEERNQSRVLHEVQLCAPLPEPSGNVPGPRSLSPPHRADDQGREHSYAHSLVYPGLLHQHSQSHSSLNCCPNSKTESSF